MCYFWIFCVLYVGDVLFLDFWYFSFLFYFFIKNGYDIYFLEYIFINFYFYFIIIIKIVFDREVNWIFDLVKLRVLYEVLK